MITSLCQIIAWQNLQYFNYPLSSSGTLIQLKSDTFPFVTIIVSFTVSIIYHTEIKHAKALNRLYEVTCFQFRTVGTGKLGLFMKALNVPRNCCEGHGTCICGISEIHKCYLFLHTCPAKYGIGLSSF